MTLSWKTLALSAVALAIFVAPTIYVLKYFKNPAVVVSQQKPPSLESVVVARAKIAAAAFFAQDPNAIAALVHPTAGVRFSLYNQINDVRDKKFTPSQITKYFGTNVKFTWGVQDGSGEKIVMPMKKFFANEYADHDFSQAPSITYDTFVNRGNAISNVEGFYPNAHVVEFYFPGFVEKYADMDWRAIQVVMQEFEGQWYVVDVVSNRWTI